jgi:hypothetical protein
MQVRTRATAWFGLVVFAYYYKVLVFGFGGEVLDIETLTGTWISGIDLNHWIETAVYCPLVWFALHQVNADVFGDAPRDPVTLARHRRSQTIGDTAIALFLYGTGLHIANVIELSSRELHGVDSGDVYDLVYFLDEGLSHYLQFVPLFFVIGWFVVHDRPGRTDHASMAVFFGVAHGVERAIGIIEGGKWFLGAPTVLWLALAVAARVHRSGPSGFDEFFVRYAVAFCVTLPIAEIAYRVQVGSFGQPSSLDRGVVVEVVIGAIAMTLLGTALALRWGRPSRDRHAHQAASVQPFDTSTTNLAGAGQSVTRPSRSTSLFGSIARVLHHA